LSGEMWNLSPLLYDVATIPSAILMVNMEALMGPKISSTLPTWVLFSRKIGPLKYGTCGDGWGGCGEESKETRVRGCGDHRHKKMSTKMGDERRCFFS
jgi:hypothetical protein